MVAGVGTTAQSSVTAAAQYYPQQYNSFQRMGAAGIQNAGLTTQTHPMSVNVPGGPAAAAMNSMQFHSPGLHGLNPNMQGGTLQR